MDSSINDEINLTHRPLRLSLRLQQKKREKDLLEKNGAIKKDSSPLSNEWKSAHDIWIDQLNELVSNFLWAKPNNKKNTFHQHNG